jgi:hypothetical protein
MIPLFPPHLLFLLFIPLERRGVLVMRTKAGDLFDDPYFFYDVKTQMKPKKEGENEMVDLDDIKQ